MQIIFQLKKKKAGFSKCSHFYSFGGDEAMPGLRRPQGCWTWQNTATEAKDTCSSLKKQNKQKTHHFLSKRKIQKRLG